MTESEQNINTYLDYITDGDIDGTVFRDMGDCMHIYQETDEDDEPDKYLVVKGEVSEELWNSFTSAINNLDSRHKW